MSKKSKNPFSFWQELKRRKVFRVIAMYAAAAYVIIELSNNIVEPLRLPEWVPTLIIVMLVIGFPFAVIFSWIFDVTPKGIQKTKSAKVAREKEAVSKPAKRKLKVSDIIIAVLLVAVVILVYPKIFKKDKFEDIRDEDGRISVAVMPFENHTGDTTLNWFSNGISSLIINVLGNSTELAVCDDHTMYEVTQSANQVYTAGISPAKAQGIAKLAEARTYITGSYQGREDTYWILANLVDTETGNVISTHRVEGNLQSSGYLEMAGSLCDEIKTHLEITAIEENAGIDVLKAYTRSAEAYRHYIEGLNMFAAGEYDPAIMEFKRAFEIDTTFILASLFIAYSHNLKTVGVDEEVKFWILKTYNNKEKLPLKYQYWVGSWYAWIFSKNGEDMQKNLEMMEVSGVESRFWWMDIALTYSNILFQHEKSINAFEKVLEKSKKLGEPIKDLYFYTQFGRSLHYIGMHEREKEIYELALNIFNDDISKREIYYNWAICALSQNDTLAGNKYLEEYLNAKKRLGHTQDNIEYFLGRVYDLAGMMKEAEVHIRKACELGPPNNTNWIGLADFLIDSEIDVEEGIEIAERFLELYPNSGNIRRIIAFGLFKQGNYEEAYKLIKEAIEKFPIYDQEFEDLSREIEQALANQKSEY